jgi:hypothetical protein
MTAAAVVAVSAVAVEAAATVAVCYSIGKFAECVRDLIANVFFESPHHVFYSGVERVGQPVPYS